MDYMARALALARLALGRTSPNPAVGAVLVKSGQVVGEGYTQPAGSWHAEVVALQKAGEMARGATLYVTLEPCAHFGRTPPCTQAIIRAGVAEVHMAMLDPNPLVGGRGRRQLEEAGIPTQVGEYEAEARELNESFIKYITTGLPFVVAKWAMTLDGKIATASGHSKWITGETARKRAHELRDVSDVILVGVNTVITDDPQLTIRLVGESGRPPRTRDPWRVIVDSRGRIPLTARVLSPALAQGTIIASTELSDPLKRKQMEESGAEVLLLPEKDGHVDLSELIALLGKRGVTNVLAEGGGELLASLFTAGLVDKVYAFIAPKIIGGSRAPTPVGGLGIKSMAEALTLKDRRVEILDDDVLIQGYPRRNGG
ncbi:MAG: bifunctional diaminohydroxyphosphoribosylaminopyrimidine deaminase/5-amino-6-(5-phosphoribosylamino)uracil reductase RibD [Chloroflexi bacterium]|nr:bifunctional diaminohydroxyphosphoribosylaminopyrimidine deaminase/5-amino-6-(5-phosphoribosylamino)uracil reductase RibD [Chloroflexota bacterium]MCL5075167.1 bifunctional diaminohydroxyphosphoribosylaminopyrimidine deaminase/5-amino-6-(5-phosphoribosylamino)uracil reductase RibD [Chloroflexota bacterium]